MSKYAWQDGLWASFKGNGFNGLLKAPTGAGKTIASCKVLSMYREEFPDSKIWVAVPSRLLIEQWTEVLDKNELDDVIVYHYATASLRLEDYLMGREEDLTPDLLVCDEAHLLNSPTGTLWKNVINYGIPHILGLSATPSGAEGLIGGTILEVDWDQCNISESINNLVLFRPSKRDMDKYVNATNSMRGYRDEYNPNATFYNDMAYRNLIMRRKGVLRNISKRYDIALHYVKQTLGKRTIVFFSTKKQINTFEKMLKKEGIECAVQVSGREEIEDFHPETGTKDILLCINMLEQGYDDPTLEVGIMASFDNSVRRNIQRCGRLLRPHEDKVAETYYLIAEGTTDEEIIGDRNVIFPPGTTRVVRYYE